VAKEIALKLAAASLMREVITAVEEMLHSNMAPLRLLNHGVPAFP
jgi:hypothetical protein